MSSKKKTAREKTMAWRVAVASVIKRTREEKRRNQADFAKELGWSVDKLALMESGEGKVEFGEIVMISDALGVPREKTITRILAWR